MSSDNTDCPVLTQTGEAAPRQDCDSDDADAYVGDDNSDDGDDDVGADDGEQI